MKSIFLKYILSIKLFCLQCFNTRLCYLQILDFINYLGLRYYYPAVNWKLNIECCYMCIVHIFWIHHQIFSFKYTELYILCHVYVIMPKTTTFLFKIFNNICMEYQFFFWERKTCIWKYESNLGWCVKLIYQHFRKKT